jgi:hypothetical protein
MRRTILAAAEGAGRGDRSGDRERHLCAFNPQTNRLRQIALSKAPVNRWQRRQLDRVGPSRSDPSHSSSSGEIGGHCADPTS